LYETKQEVITDEYLDKAKSIVTKLQNRGFGLDDACAMAGNIWAESQFDSSAEGYNGAFGLLQWLGDRKKALKIVKLIEAIQREPFTGIASPEPLKHELSGAWSRRIDKEHRLVYQVFDNKIKILSCRYHY